MTILFLCGEESPSTLFNITSHNFYELCNIVQDPIYPELVGSPCIHFPIVIKATLCMWRRSPPTSTLSAYYIHACRADGRKWRNNLYSVNHLGHRVLYAKMIILWEYPWTWWITKESSSWLKIVGGRFCTALHTGAKRWFLYHWIFMTKIMFKV